MPEEYDDDTQLAIDITALTERIGLWANGRDFWKGSALADAIEMYADDLAAEDKIKPHQQKDIHAAAALLRTYELGTKIALAHTELSEMTEELRLHTASGVIDGQGNFGGEGADVFIRLADLLFNSNQDLGKEVLDKIAENDERDLVREKKRNF